MIYINNKILLREIHKPIKKESNVIGEPGVAVVAIWDKIDKALINI